MRAACSAERGRFVAVLLGIVLGGIAGVGWQHSSQSISDRAHGLDMAARCLLVAVRLIVERVDVILNCPRVGGGYGAPGFSAEWPMARHVAIIRAGLGAVLHGVVGWRPIG